MSVSVEQVKNALDTIKTWVEENDPDSARRICQKLNAEGLRKATREGELAKLRKHKELQDSCPHLLGCTGASVGVPPPKWPVFDKQLGAFFGQKLSTGGTIGICCYCRKKISSLDPEDSKYFAEDSEVQWFNLNKNAEAGSAWIDNPKNEGFIEFPPERFSEVKPGFISELDKLETEELKDFLVLYKKSFE